MFLILADSDEAALEAAEQALEGIETVPYTVGKFASSGTKVGGKKYTNAIATTNDTFCPVLTHYKIGKPSRDVKCIYEVIVTGLQLESVCKAMEVGIEYATRPSGILAITSANYGGTLGKGKILLHSLFKDAK
jgi:formylmethanofuran--tetrahydromethanopterin N-formyltransferase